MKRIPLLAAAVVAVVAVLVAAAPASASASASANSRAQRGPKLPLFGPVTTFPTNTPFYVEQGFIVPLGDGSGMYDEISARANSTL